LYLEVCIIACGYVACESAFNMYNQPSNQQRAEAYLDLGRKDLAQRDWQKVVKLVKALDR